MMIIKLSQCILYGCIQTCQTIWMYFLIEDDDLLKKYNTNLG